MAIKRIYKKQAILDRPFYYTIVYMGGVPVCEI